MIALGSLSPNRRRRFSGNERPRNPSCPRASGLRAPPSLLLANAFRKPNAADVTSSSFAGGERDRLHDFILTQGEAFMGLVPLPALPTEAETASPRPSRGAGGSRRLGWAQRADSDSGHCRDCQASAFADSQTKHPAPYNPQAEKRISRRACKRAPVGGVAQVDHHRKLAGAAIETAGGLRRQLSKVSQLQSSYTGLQKTGWG